MQTRLKKMIKYTNKFLKKAKKKTQNPIATKCLPQLEPIYGFV